MNLIKEKIMFKSLFGFFNNQSVGEVFDDEIEVVLQEEMQESYGGEGYSMPSEFEKLFLKYGYMKEEIVVKKVYKKIR